MQSRMSKRLTKDLEAIQKNHKDIFTVTLPNDDMKLWHVSFVGAKESRVLVDLFGANRVAVGSDYPFPLGEHLPGKLVDSMPWDAPTKALVKSGAALEWLGVQPG